MSWKPNEKEMRSVLSLPGPQRYSYSIKRIAAWEVVWSLRNGGWVVMGDDQGRECVPIWPHEAYALLCATGDWENMVPKFIELDAWLERWIPGMERDHRLIAVFPNLQQHSVVVEPARLKADIEAELANYDE